MIDLGAWASEAYRVAAESVDPEDFARERPDPPPER
jgi:endogenous inhibitor of DNA gyrase (YacG/DUF329 family)